MPTIRHLHAGAFHEFEGSYRLKRYEEFFGLEDIKTDFLGVLARLYRSSEHRIMAACGNLTSAPEKRAA